MAAASLSALLAVGLAKQVPPSAIQHQDLQLAAGGDAPPIQHQDRQLAAGGDAPPLRLLLNVPHPERLPMLLDVYQQIPWHILFAVAPANLTGCRDVCGARCECVELPSQCDSVVAGGQGGKTGFQHSLLVAPHADGSSDLLYAHGDMWLSRRLYDLVRGKHRHSIVLPAGLENVRCAAPGTREWQQYSRAWTALRAEGFFPKCRALLSGGGPASEAHRLLRQANVCCHGWSDLLYLPRATQPMFAAMATGPFGELSVAEGAIVTIAEAITRANISQARASAECAGDCCIQRINLAPGQTTYDLIQAGTVCAHPVDLRNSSAWYEAQARQVLTLGQR